MECGLTTTAILTRARTTPFRQLHSRPGRTFQEQVANGKITLKNDVFNSAQKAWSPRVGMSWDPNKKGDWVVRGGVGIFHNWVTPANAQEEFRGNPPGPIYPTFFSTGAIQPLFVLGNSNVPPFGFTYPAVPGGQLDAHGGIVGLQPGIGAIDPNLLTPVSYNFSAQCGAEAGPRYGGLGGILRRSRPGSAVGRRPAVQRQLWRGYQQLSRATWFSTTARCRRA